MTAGIAERVVPDVAGPDPADEAARVLGGAVDLRPEVVLVAVVVALEARHAVVAGGGFTRPTSRASAGSVSRSRRALAGVMSCSDAKAVQSSRWRLLWGRQLRLGPPEIAAKSRSSMTPSTLLVGACDIGFLGGAVYPIACSSRTLRA